MVLCQTACDKVYNNKQLLDEVEHDIMNYQNRGLLLSAEAEG